MAALDPRIEAVREKYGLEKSDFWELPQKRGTWVAKHAALEVAAAKADIRFDMPVIIEQDAAGLVTSLVVQGTMGNRSEWSIGETNPSNYHVTGKQPSYPWAMAEKRAKDRVILKLIGVHGVVYSEEEADDFKGQQHASAGSAPEFAQPDSKAHSRETFAVVMAALRKAGNTSKAALREFWTGENFLEAYETMPEDWKTELVAEKDGFLASYGKPAIVDPNASLDRQFAETVRN